MMAAHPKTLPHPLCDPGLANELHFHVRELWVRTTRALGIPMPAGDVQQVADVYTLQLIGELGEVIAETAARSISSYLVDGRYLDDPKWWGTPLGRAIAWHIGYHYSTAHTTVVQAMLGVTRQAVSQMIATGRLEAAANAHVTTRVTRASLREELHRRVKEEK